MKRKVILLSAVIFILWQNLIQGVPIDMKGINLMPWPADIQLFEGQFRLNNEFTVQMKSLPTSRLIKAVNRSINRLANRTGLFFKHNQIIEPQTAKTPGMIIVYQRPGKIKLGEDESYCLEISPEQIKITAQTDIGVIYALETLRQLLSADANGYFFPNILINDRPRFPWRGLLIDSCRHFMPIEVLKRNLDGMVSVKMNVFHWHLSEDQGFRLECKTYPKLHQMGSDGLYYTQNQIKEIIEYATDRGIRIVPEFDIPGHSTSWLVGYPEHASAKGTYQIERKWGVFDPVFNPTVNSTYRFFKRFFAEICPLFPDDYIHIGGDEVNGNQWNANLDIQRFKQKHKIANNHGLQAYFNKKILSILRKNRKKMVGWDEIYQPEMPTDIVIQSWQGKEALFDAAKKGYQTILSNGYYIDLCQPTYFHYLNDPLPDDAVLDIKAKKNILGGEATMWSELVTPENVDSRIWPRTAAIAERFWSPSSIKDIDHMYQRLAVISSQLEEHGLTHIKNQKMMLHRLSGGDCIAPLKTLIEVVEPLEQYQRHEQGIQYTSFSPLTRMVDAAGIDPLTPRKFKKDVDLFLKNRDQTKAESLIILLKKWHANHEKLVPIIDKSPIIKEIEPVSRDLSDAAKVGLEILDQILKRSKIDLEWLKEKEEILSRAKKTKGEMELLIIEPIEQLLLNLKNQIL